MLIIGKGKKPAEAEADEAEDTDEEPAPKVDAGAMLKRRAVKALFAAAEAGDIDAGVKALDKWYSACGE